MTEDLEYVRTLGEETCTRLFLRPGESGYPSPVEVEYQINGKTMSLLFVARRTIQSVGKAMDDFDPGDTLVIFDVVDGLVSNSDDGTRYVVVAKLSFGEEPQIDGDVDSDLVALLRAVAGVL